VTNGPKSHHGRKHIVPYGLYRAHIFINAKLRNERDSGRPISRICSKSGFDVEHDDRQRGGKCPRRRGIAFRHGSAFGNAHAHALFDRVKVHRKIRDELFEPGSDRLSNYPPARRFSDYEITVDHDDLPESVEVVELF